MSRTIRRRHVNEIYYLKSLNYTYEDAPGYEYLSSWAGIPQIRKEGKEYRKVWWEFHNDSINFHNKCFRSDWGSVRTKNRLNLVRHLNDSDHDYFFWEDVNSRDWL